MTREEMHAKIEARILGLSTTCSAFTTGNNMYEPDYWLCSECGRTDDYGPLDSPHERVPLNYSECLDLCARAEAKIAEMGHEDKYSDLLSLTVASAKFPKANPEIVRHIVFDRGLIHLFALISASAEQRVDAMIALIEELGL